MNERPQREKSVLMELRCEHCPGSPPMPPVLSQQVWDACSPAWGQRCWAEHGKCQKSVGAVGLYPELASNVPAGLGRDKSWDGAQESQRCDLCLHPASALSRPESCAA